MSKAREIAELGDVVTVDDSNIGIGTSSPYKSLTVGNTDATAWITSGGSNVHLTVSPNGASGAFIVRTGGTNGDPSTTTERMRIDSSGNVGIGQAPSNFSGWTTLEIKGGSNGAMLNFEDSSSARVAAVASASDRLRIQTFVAEPITLETNNTERMRIDSSGNVDLYQGNSLTWRYAAGSTIRGSISIDSADNITFSNGSSNTERMRIDTSGNVGIGTSSPSALIDLGTSLGQKLLMYANGNIKYGFGIESSELRLFAEEQAVMTFGGMSRTDGSTYDEHMRITSSGNLLVGKTNDADSGTGVRVRGDGLLQATRSGADPLSVNRTSNHGDVVRFYKDGTAAGGISAHGSGMVYYSSTIYTGLGGDASNPYYWGYSLAFYPSEDNSRDLGTSGNRYDDVFATNGTIQTSDQNEKQQIASLTDAEIIAAKAISKLFKTFKWNDSVTEKGDAARTHTGVIAQQVEAAMTDAGLDAGDYAFFISSTWWETQTNVPAVEADEENGVEAQEAYTRIDKYYTLEEAPEGATERNRKGIRYPQLLSFIGAATEQRLASIESRLDALEA